MGEAAAVQMNVRIDPALKQIGDEVLARNGTTPSKVIRSLWRYFADRQSVPPFLMGNVGCEDGREAKRRIAHEGFGLVGKLAAQNGLEMNEAIGCQEARDRMYDAMLDEMFPELDSAE